MDRREFLKLAGVGVLSGSLAGCSIALPLDIIKAYEDSLKRKENISRIYNELPKHVYMAETVTEYKGEEKKVNNFGTGIILEGKYLTMNHIIDSGLTTMVFAFGSYMEIPRKVVGQETFLKGKRLEKVFSDLKSDVAIFDLPDDLNLPDFPAKPSEDIELGEEVYILGNPLLSGQNVIKANISDLDGLNFKYLKERNLLEDSRINLMFGIDKFVYLGDSGSPCVSSNFELLGLIRTALTRGKDSNGLGHILKIDNFTKHF